MIDAKQPNSPGWWLERLLKQLHQRNDSTNRLDAYLCGTNGIPITRTKATREAYQRLMHMARLLRDAGGYPAHGNQRKAWDAGCRFDHPNPDYR